ncbi:phytanoyl-CoA dioxygenase family protein [Pseudomonas sp. 21LCFQ010]|uniref:phytanoyl-CoA dioxygenase family protein n=1 Tax=Pseudomonas sp. 21LCFQ010 TaxID=2957506 RepID=UPI0020970A02|nr:phytanoyl-CoA dioxygenase family protein [Pseudomonas sp. 21LCFQ010]MCO8163215.1 phytanoyl-CoA dioxygenase family protein [Pseudomonas sp. 21LCFQ010]
MGKILDRDQIRFYREQGYLIAEDIFDPRSLDETLTHFNLAFAQQLERLALPVAAGTTLDSLHQNMITVFGASVELYLATLRMCSKLYGVYQLMTTERLRDVTADLGITTPLFQTTPVLHLMSKKLIIPGGYQGFDAHQDWTSVQGSLDTITTWIPFMDIDPHLFTMEVIPKSHLLGLLSGAQEQHVLKVSDTHFTEEDFVPICVGKGGVCLMSNFTIHRSSRDGDERIRISVSGRYENASERSFVEREYPFTQHKSMQRGFITENFPSVEQVRAMYAREGE